MFGGRYADNQASDTLLIFKVFSDKKHSRPVFKIIKPKTLGAGPAPRYMHTIDFVPQLGIVTIFGGRNDFLQETQILFDLYILRLHNLEWVRA
mmetsp:Transcript_18274/g.28091  ORF Transcript_18274/g.28091 Transcript_18274/m.28091 type:complete len:93 (-) Transcript_18274:158-436(-)